MSRGFPSHYRKRKQISLDGSAAGVEYNRYHRGYNRSVFDNPIATGSPRPAEAYEPDPGPMETRESDYQPYEPEMPFRRPTPPFRMPLPEEPEPEKPPEYDASLITDESFVQMMREFLGGESEHETQTPLPFDHDVRGVIHGPATLDDLAASQSPADPVEEIQQAFDQNLEQMASEGAPEQPPPEPDPYQLEQQRYEDELQALMNPFGMPGFGPMM